MDGRNPAPPQRPWKDESPVNSNTYWFLRVSKWCERILSIHSKDERHTSKPAKWHSEPLMASIVCAAMVCSAHTPKDILGCGSITCFLACLYPEPIEIFEIRRVSFVTNLDYAGSRSHGFAIPCPAPGSAPENLSQASAWCVCWRGVSQENEVAIAWRIRLPCWWIGLVWIGLEPPVLVEWELFLNLTPPIQATT